MLTPAKINSEIKNCASEKVLNDGSAGRGAGSLKLRIRAFGKVKNATWIATWKRDGKPGRKIIGKYPAMSLAAAREEFKTVSAQLASGKNPHRQAVLASMRPTVEALFVAYVAHLKAREAGAAKHIEHVLLLGKYNAADALGRDTLAADVTPTDVRAPLAKAAKRGALRTADILRTYMSSAFSWGMKSANDYTTEDAFDWGIATNPVAAIPKDARANKARDRNLSPDELATFWKNIPGGAAGECIRLMILCGQRVQETLRVDGREVDTKRALWMMPAHKTKGRKHPHTIPLPPRAVEIFEALKKLHGDGPLFPARTGSKADRMGMLAVSHAVALMKCVHDFQARDIRRTWKSRAHDAGVDRFTRDLIQQHAKNDTGSKNYDRADYLPQMREAMVKWQAWLDEHVINDPASSVDGEMREAA
jgi:integrase